MKQKNQKLLAYGLCVIFACTGIAMVGWGWGTWSTKAATCCCDTTYWHHEGIRAEYFGCEDNSGKCETTSTLTITSEAEFGLFAWHMINNSAFATYDYMRWHHYWCCRYTGKSVPEEYIDYSGWTIELGGDLDLSGSRWIPIIITNVIFDGNGFAIKGLNISNALFSLCPSQNCEFMPYHSTAGLFGIAEGSIIQNLTLINPDVNIHASNIQGNSFAGTLVGKMLGGQINNCVVIDGRLYTWLSTNTSARIYHFQGGLVGLNEYGEIINSQVRNVSHYASDYTWHTWGEQKLYLGGIVGRSTGNVVNSLSYSTTYSHNFAEYTIDINDVAYLPPPSSQPGDTNGSNQYEEEELNNTANITVIIIGSLFIVLVFAFIGFVSVRQMQKQKKQNVAN